MILQTQTAANTFTKGNSITDYSVKVAANKQAKMFLILTSGLYSNPIGSIVRELTSNAVDATVEAKSTEPVIVRITEDKAEFVDFGVGLSEDRFANVFCNLLESTKENTNDQIGAWGLGSKSPFAYTDTYNVTSVYNGVKRVWSLTKDGGNISPKKLLEDNTDEPNGTIVSVPIKNSNDYHSFQNECTKQLRYFPNVYFSFDGKPNDYTITHVNEDIITSTLDSSHSPIGICLGNVHYPIDFSYLGEREVGSNYSLKFDIGELDVTPSREGILWNAKAEKLVKQKLNKVKELLKQKFLESVSHIDLDNPLSQITISNLFNKNYTLDLGGAKIHYNTNSLKHILADKLTYTGKMPATLQGKELELHKVFHSAKHLDRNGKAFTTSVNYNTTLVYFKRFSKAKAKYYLDQNLQIQYRDVRFVTISEEWQSIVDPYVDWLDDLVLPKSYKARYNHYTPVTKVQQQEFLLHKLVSGNGDFQTKKDRTICSTTDLSSLTSNGRVGFYGPDSARRKLAMLQKAGFNTYITAQSNFKYLSSSLNFYNVDDYMKAKEFKSYIKSYHKAVQVTDKLGHALCNTASLVSILPKNSFAKLTSLKEECESIRSRVDSGSTFKSFLEGAIQMLGPKLTKADAATIEKLSPINNIQHLKNCNRLSSVQGVYSKSYCDDYDSMSDEAKAFFKEYLTLKSKS